MISNPAPLEPDSDFEEDDLPQPSAKRRKLSSHTRQPRLRHESTRHRTFQEPIDLNDDVSDPESDDDKNDTKALNPLINPLFDLLELRSPLSQGSSSPFRSPLLLPKSNISPQSSVVNDEGSETDSEPESALAPLEDNDGDATESETDNEESSLQDRGVKPRLVARDDQTATGKYVLKRPKRCYDGTPVKPGPVDSVPASINKFLRDYQREGVQFFYERYCERRGGILGDDMGLGKTIQVISFLAAIMLKDNDQRDIGRRYKYASKLQDEVGNKRMPRADAKWPTALIIVPVTVMTNWERELDTWGYFEVGVYSGSAVHRANVLTDFKMGRLDIVLASYDLVRTHMDEFDDLAWSVIFLDEAHKIKNHAASITKTYNRFQCQVRFGLTGTALQNDYAELWPLLSWSNPERLGTRKEWRDIITKPLKLGQSHSATGAERDNAVMLGRRLVDKLLPKFFKRRTKDLIQNQLPRKYDEVVFCPLTKLQLEVYQNFLETEDVQLLTRKDEPCDCAEGRKERKPRCKCCYAVDDEGNSWQSKLLKYMTILLKISNHLTLLYPSDGDTVEQKQRNRVLLEVAFRHRPDMRKPSSAFLPGLCGKWIVLKQLLEGWRENKADKNKALIFSKSAKLLGFLELEISKEYGRDKLCYLDGKTKKEDRMTIVDDFNNNPEKFIFLISTTAGGTGLNLTSANRVVIFDPHWNPAHDLQAMDRAYRYGQVRDVYVYRLLGAGALEELIYARQIYKQQMMKIAYEGTAQTRFFDGVQGDKDRQGELFGIKNIFSLHKSAYATKTVIERARVEELEWALTNDGKKVAEEDDVRGVGALLLDDDSLGKLAVKRKTRDSQESDMVADILGATGVRYRHRNSDVVATSRIAGKAAEDASKRKRKSNVQITGSQGSSPKPGLSWPPKRRKHENSAIKPKPESERILQSRKRKLLLKGLIFDFHDDYRRFAVEFGNLTGEEQRSLLRMLDDEYPDDNED